MVKFPVKYFNNNLLKCRMFFTYMHFLDNICQVPRQMLVISHLLVTARVQRHGSVKTIKLSYLSSPSFNWIIFKIGPVFTVTYKLTKLFKTILMASPAHETIQLATVAPQSEDWGPF